MNSPRQVSQRISRLAVGALLAAGAVLAAALPARAEIAVTGVDGVTVTLDQPAERIVSLAPHLTELLYTAGAGDRLVGAVAYSDYPPAARRIPRVGDAFRIDLERLFSLEPDLVVAWESGNPPDAVSGLRELGVPVLVTEVHELDDIATLLVDVGRLAGTPEEAGAAANRFRGRIDALRDRYADRARVRVFFQATARPLYTVGGAHVISQVIELCGGRNVFESLEALAPAVGEEAVVAADPQVIVAGTQTGEPEPLERWRDWQGLGAVTEGHVYTLDGNLIHRSTTRIADGAERLCELIDRAR